MVRWISESVVVTEHVAACRHPKDDKFLALSVTGKAGCIVSGDSDLLDMVAFEGIPIYRAGEFLKLFVESKTQ